MRSRRRRKIAEISNAIASAVEEHGAATGEIARNVEEAASGTAAVSREIADVRAGPVKPTPAPRPRSPQPPRAASLKGNLADFLKSIRSAA